MSNWYTIARAKTNSILSSIKKHPFIEMLSNGTLPKDIFIFYVQQDTLYLAEYKKIVTLIGMKLSSAAASQFFLDTAKEIMAVENALHNTFLKNQKTIPHLSSTCKAYTDYLSNVVYKYTIEEALAAILPCFTIYKEVGDFILANQDNKIENPYENWIKTYGGEAFAQSVKQAVEITNDYAHHTTEDVREKMNRHFIKVSQLEWMFWESAYNKAL